MRKFYVGLFFLAFTSCQVDDFNTPEYRSKIVVDGWIEQGQPARVFLTLSVPYFSEVDSTSLRNLVLTHAKVTVYDGLNEEILTLRPNPDYFPPIVYEGTSLKGIIGHSYILKVEYSGKVITSKTQIPEPEELDTIWYKPQTDTTGSINISFEDRLGIDNFYRILTRTGTKTLKFTPVFLPNLDGRIIDGQKVNLTIFKSKSGEVELFNIKDTVFLKFCTIDQNSYKFWSSLNAELNNSQNPFASSNSHVKSNVEGGLGIWCGYGVNTYRIICKMKEPL